MSYIGFVIALAGEVGTASYERPNRILRERREWLIAARWGRDGEYVSLSSTRQTPDTCSPAPIGLVPRITCLGVLLSPGGKEDVDTFLLVRRLPPGITVAGTFSPAYGYVRLYGPVGNLRLTAAARHSADVGRRDGGLIACNSSQEVACRRTGASWHIDARRRPWAGEFVEGTCEHRLAS
ncbi:MAG TPA: hypothetical protein VN702_20470 [Acetobacteraceae bacterium]|nr:hypothetical protein [Acetobacteraceae bacterium]